MQANLRQRPVFVEIIKRGRLDLLAEEVIAEADLVYALVPFKSLNDAHEAGIVETTRTEVKSLQLSGTVALACNNLRENFDNLIAKEILVTNECLDLCVSNNIAKDLEA